MRALFFALLLTSGQDRSFEIEEERAARDEQFRSPEYASPLTAVDQIMVESGSPAYLVHCEAEIHLSAGTSGCVSLVEMQFEAGQFLATPLRRTEGTWGPGTPFTRELRVTPGFSDIRGRLLITRPEAAEGYALYFSLQGSLGRVMLHNTRAERLVSFEGLRYYDVDPIYRFVVRIHTADEQELIPMATTQGLQKKFRRLGTVAFEVPEGGRRLTVFSPVDSPHDLFVPFRDTTNGKETYPMGRYLYLRDGPEPATYVLDFNLAFNPYCAYSPHYNCPYPPRENHLDIPIPAGEKAYREDPGGDTRQP